jgi:hypothetical protein
MGRYIYRANGLALGGSIGQPDPGLISPQGSLVLSVDGGGGSIECGPYRGNPWVSFERAVTQVLGSQHQPDGPYETLAQVAIEGLNIHDMVTADRIVARLASTNDGTGESRILPLGSTFENLRIAGRPVHYDDLTGVFCRHATLQDVQRAYAGDEAFRKLAHACFWWGGAPDELTDDVPAELRERAKLYTRATDGALPLSHGTALCSIVGHVRVEGLTTHANVVVVPQFGRVHLGELLVQADSRRLSMLRVDLGCPLMGAVVADAVETNGHKFP